MSTAEDRYYDARDDRIADDQEARKAVPGAGRRAA